MSNLLAVLGILLVFVGTFWTVAATLRHPGFLSDPEFQYGAQERIRIVDEARRKGWDTAPPELRRSALDEARAEHLEDLRDHASRTATEWRAHRATVVRHSLIGLGLIALGSVAQGIAIIVSNA